MLEVDFELVAFCELVCVLLVLFVCVSLTLAKRMTRSCTWNVAPGALLPFGAAPAEAEIVEAAVAEDEVAVDGATWLCARVSN